MIMKHIDLGGKKAEGYVVPLNGVNLVFAKTEQGMVGCGAFDVKALDKFKYAAAKVAGPNGGPIVTLDDLLAGEIREPNEAAKAAGVKSGMHCGSALKLL